MRVAPVVSVLLGCGRVGFDLCTAGCAGGGEDVVRTGFAALD
jgi:hypothetical protein